MYTEKTLRFLRIFSYSEHLIQPLTKPLLPIVEILAEVFTIIFPSLITLKTSYRVPFPCSVHIGQN